MGPAWVVLGVCVASMSGGRESTLAFQDVTAQVGLPTAHNALWGANWYDSDADGWLDLHLNGHFQLPLLFDNLGNQCFQDVSYRFPADKPPPQDRHSFLFSDFNRDGFPDLYVVHGGGEHHYPDGSQWCELLYYDPAADLYVDVTAGTGLEDPYGRGRGAALFDFNGDGIADLYKTNTATNPPPPSETPCLAFLGNLSGGFTRDPSSGLELIIGTWGAPLPCDYDNDGDTDVLVRGAGGGPTGINALMRNDGGVFTNVTEAAGLAGTRDNASAAWGDYDNDGWMDLVIAHENTPPGAPLALYRNQHDGTFAPITNAGLDRVGIFEELAWADFDNDGCLDLYVGAYYLDGEPTRNLLYRNHGDGTFEEVALAAGVPATIGGMDPVVALADYDRDGLVDIFTGVGFFRPFEDPDQPLYLYRNVTPTTNNYLEIELRGPAGNELALGTRVSVSRGNQLEVRQQNGGVSHHSQDSPVLHFGMGDVNRALVQAHWPNGTVTDYCTHANRYCVLTYYDGPPMLTDGPLVGAVTAHSAAIFARASSASTVQVLYSPNSDLSGATLSDLVSAAEDKDFTALVPLRDLPVETRIYYDILVDGQSQLQEPLPSFVTFPERPVAFTVGLLADLATVDQERSAPAYAALAATNPAFVIQLGDFDHRDPLILPCMQQMHREVRSPGTASGLDFDTYIARQFPFFHVWDDHDFGENNADKTFPGKADALQAFQEYYPTLPLPNPQAGIWHSFRYGQAEFFLLDCRAQRDPAADEDGPDKSMLDGDDLPDGQKQWLLNGLLHSTATWKFIVSSVPFNPRCKPADSWGAYTTERQEILDFIRAARIHGVVVISADAHTGGAIDDGSNSGLREISVPHTNLSESDSRDQACPGWCWSEGKIPGQGHPGFALVHVATDPDRAWLETYGEDGTLRQSFLINLPAMKHVVKPQ